ncbi:E3 ubiquitin-protein ligase lubel like protein [Argiope bruennichi]|uniref:E3 ubiquitin-protein ligase lubel like protein n=1 Tax=Argiope bruennichi TaxID=94029 RepID=A0A8T0F6P4_ARGBR|nr:E3 ubiquitin-protein ligase lubel like protein [Argiope bruennichi]
MEEAENSDNGPIPKNDDLLNSPAKSCALCGCSTPAVRCDRCSGQIFCLSCDDMYHRHPKRRLHLRKAVDSIWNSARSPRLRRRTDLPGDPSKIPIPPPRSKKRERHTIGGRMFLKPNHELGSFGHSKVFDMRSLTPTSKDVFAGPKTPTSIEGTYDFMLNKCEESIGEDSLENEESSQQIPPNDPKEVPEASVMLCTETQTFTTTKSTDVQTQNLICKSMASSTDSIFPKQEISVQTEKTETTAKSCSVATDPMISSQSMESLLSGMSAPPYHNRRAGWGRGTSFSTQSLFERGRSRSPIPRSLSMYNEAQSFGRDSSLPPEEAMHSWSQAWLMSDPMYYKPHNLPGLEQPLVKEDYFDGTWGSMDKLNRRMKNKQGEKFKSQQRPKLHRSLDDLKAEKTQDFIHSRELQFLQTVKEAERCGFSLEDLHVAFLHCGREDPVIWLEDNWSSMIKNVIALAAKYGEDNEENDVGIITATEAKEALHIHRGDIWDAVTECIENRQRKILELTVRGNFTQKQIADALKNNEGNIELAYADLLRASTKRHKFILSPGLKKRKKSDFLTKLSAIRQAQSDRRKAREEKEMIRETVTQEIPTTLDDSEIDSLEKKEITEDNIPEIMNQTGGETQGEWIEEYSDEHWDDESDEHWIALQKKYQKMEKEFEHEAMQMAALWEKEELSDDVFEDEPKEALQSAQEREAEDKKKLHDEEILAKQPNEQKYIFESQMSENKISEETKSVMHSESFVSSPKRELSPGEIIENKYEVSKEKSPEVAVPKPPVRRKSKLNTAAIEEALRNQPQTDLDVPPALPQKKKDKSPDKSAIMDLYAVPQKLHRDEKKNAHDAPAPLKPPRLNLSPSAEPEQQQPGEIEDKKFLNIEFSKEASPVTSQSNESDSNCFADSESDPEIKIIRQKYMHHKPPKYENEDEELFEDSFIKSEVDPAKSLRHAVEDTNVSFEFNPELPIPVGSRGSCVVDEMASPKAFREGSARPLQLFKVVKQEPSQVVSPKIEAEQVLDTSAVKNILEEQTSKHIIEGIEQPVATERLMNEFAFAEPQIETSQATDSYYYNAEAMEQIPEDAMLHTSNLHYYNIEKVEDISPSAASVSLQADSSYYYNAEEVMHTPEFKNSPETMEFHQEEIRTQSQLTNNIPVQFEETIPETPFQTQPESKEEEEEEEIVLPDLDIMPAAAEYFFGRYNEVTVAKPKKKSPVVKSNKPTTVPKVMSTSEIKIPSPDKSLSTMEVSASPVMMSADVPLDKPVKIEGKLDNLKSSPNLPSVPAPEIPPEPVTTEYVSFAEDYFFGSYNEIVPKKVKKKPMSTAPKSKIADKNKLSNVATPNELSNKMTTSSLETGITGANQANLSMTTSLPEAFHQTPSNLVLDANAQMLQTSVFAESSDLSVNKLPVETSESGEMLDSKTRVVHFEEMQPVAPPPRKKKAKPESNTSSTSSYAEEHRYMEHYEERKPLSILDKKKLPPYSEDFRMNQGCDPSNLPSNSLLPSAEQQESVVSSEISLHTSGKSFIIEKEAEKMKEIENVDSQNFEIPSPDKVKGFSDSPSIYQIPLDSPEKTVVPEIIYQGEGGLFKSSVQLQESQNFILPSTCEEVTSMEHSKISEVTSVLSENSSHLMRDKTDEIHSLHPELSNDTSEKISQEFLEASKITSIIFENIPAALNKSEEDFKSECRAPSDIELQVPEFSSNIESQIQESSKISKDISVNSEDYTMDFTQSQELFESDKQENIQPQISLSRKNQELSIISEDDSLSITKNYELEQALIESSDIQIAEYSKISEEFSLNPDDTLSVLTFEQSAFETSQTNLASALFSRLEDSEDKLKSESFAEKLESEEISQKSSECDNENYGIQYGDSKLEDDYSILQMDEDFEDGLRLVEETEKLISEFCDIYPSECFDVSSNEIQNLNTKNNKQDSTYDDSEYEWKLNEERYNSLNANFIENKAYRMDITSGPSPIESNAPLIINTGTPTDNLELNKSITESRKSTSSLADISEISEFIDESNLTQIDEKNDTVGRDDVSISVQPLSVYCQATTSNSQSISSEIMPSDPLLFSEKETLETVNEASDDSLVTSEHSSVSTQIAVFADTLLQDLTEDLGISLDNKTTEGLGEKSSTTIPLNLPETELIIAAGKKEETENETAKLNENIKSVDEAQKVSNDLHDFDSKANKILDSECYASEKLEVDRESEVQQIEDKSIKEPSGLHMVSSSIECMEDHETQIIKSLDSEIESEKNEELSTEIEVEQAMSNKQIADELSENEMADKIDDLYFSNSNAYETSDSRCDETVQDTVSDDVEEPCFSLMSHFYDEWIGKTEEHLEIQQSEEFNDEIKIGPTEELDLEIAIEETEELMKEIETKWTENESKVETMETSDAEITSDYPEEPSLSLMSHFYDEWIENVKISETQPTFQIDIRNLYVSNDLSESASSGNVSENEDFTSNNTTELLSQYTESNLNNVFIESIPVDVENEPIQLSDQGRIYISDEKDQSLNDAYVESVPIVIENEPNKLSDQEKIYISDEKDQLSEQGTILSESLFKNYDEDVMHSTIQEVKIEDVVNKISIKTDDSAPDMQDISKHVEVEIIDNFVEKMYSISKSCQTDDSFEEDQFFDSFDDPNFDPTFIFPPVLKSALSEPVRTEIGVQCCLIPSEIALISDIAVISLDTSESHKEMKEKAKEEKAEKIKGAIQVDDVPALQNFNMNKDVTIVSDSSTKQKEDSSSETTEDTDSDIFLEPYSSHDEFETGSKSKGYLYAEIDSDTGFSSGSDSGRRSSKQKSYTKETVNLPSKKIDSVSLHDENTISHKVSVQETEISTVELVGKSLSHVVIKSEDTMLNKEEIESSVNEKQEIILTEQIKITTDECIVSDDIGEIDLPPEILERAVTPISIKRVPSVESDLKFVDIEDELDSSELKEQIIETKICDDRVRTPTVEYFYGSLPQTVQEEIQQENNEYFAEALELLDTCASEVEKDISENSFSTQMSDSKFSLPADSGDMEDFSESLASFHEPEDDLLTESISEYFGLPDSEGALSSEPKVSKKFSKAEIVQDFSTQVKSSVSVCDEHKSSLKIQQEIEPNKVSTLEQQKLIMGILKSSPTNDINENLFEIEIQKKSEAFEKNAKETVTEIKIEKTSKSDIFSENNAQNFFSVNIPQTEDIESDNLNKDISEDIESFPLPSEIENINALNENEQKERPADISITSVDAHTENKSAYNDSKPGDSLYLDSITDYFSVEKASSKKVSEVSLDTEDFYQKSIPEYLSTEISAENTEQAKSLEHLKDSKVPSSVESNSDVISVDSDLAFSETFDQSYYQETEISIYEDSSEHFKNVNELEITKQSEVPPVPSDIVRYLYYDDSIKFEDDPSTCEDSLNSMHFSEESSSLMPNFKIVSEEEEVFDIDQEREHIEFKTQNHSLLSSTTQESEKVSNDISRKPPSSSLEISTEEISISKADQDGLEKYSAGVHNAKEIKQESKALDACHSVESASAVELENVSGNISTKQSADGLKESSIAFVDYGILEKSSSDIDHEKGNKMQQESEVLDKYPQLEPEKVPIDISFEHLRSDEEEFLEKPKPSKLDNDGFEEFLSDIPCNEEHKLQQLDILDKYHPPDSSSKMEVNKVSNDISMNKSKDFEEAPKELEFIQDQIKLDNLEKLDKSHGSTDDATIHPDEERMEIILEKSKSEGISHPVLQEKATIEEITTLSQEIAVSLSSASNNQCENPVVELQEVSGPSEIPSKPSDIVRYLYYDDSIKFEGDESFCDESLNSVHSPESSSLPVLEIASTDIITSDLDVDEKASLQESMKLDVDQPKRYLLQPSKDAESPESCISSPSLSDEQFICASDNEKDQFESIYSVSESTEQWFDLDTSKSFQPCMEESEISVGSDHLTETKTTTQDGDLPCMPNLLLEGEVKDDAPIAVADSDDVTDISTHFTMTEDESDKFSDIESDSSINNFDEDGLFAVDQNKNEVTDFEINKINDIEEDKEYVIDDLLDQNANKNEENYPEECATPTDFEKQEQDIEASLRDVNGNLAAFISNSNAPGMAENVGSAIQETDSILPKDLNISIQMTESEIFTMPPADVMRYTPTESCKDEFFDISQVEDSLNISKTEPDNGSRDQNISKQTTESEISTSDAAVMRSTPTESCKDEFFDISQVEDSLNISKTEPDNGPRDQNISKQTAESEISTSDTAVMRSTPTENYKDQFFDISLVEDSLNISKTEPDNGLRDQNILKPTTESEISTSDSAVMRSTPTESCKDEFFDISQAEDSLDVSITENADNFIDAESGGLIEAETLKFNLLQEGISETVSASKVVDNLIKEEFCGISNRENVLSSDDQLTKISDNTVPAQLEESLFSETKCVSKEHLFKTEDMPIVDVISSESHEISLDEIIHGEIVEEMHSSNIDIVKTCDVSEMTPDSTYVSDVMESTIIRSEKEGNNISLTFEQKDAPQVEEVIPDDNIISSFSHETSSKQDESNQIFEEILSSDLVAIKTSNVSEISPSIAYMHDVLENVTILPEKEDSNFCATIEQRDVSQETHGGFYETKEKDSDDFPKSLESLPSPVSDVSGTECIPNFGTEGKISPPLDEDASLEDTTDICAQLKTASHPVDRKLKADEIEAVSAEENCVVDFKGIIGGQDDGILSCQLKDNEEVGTVSISISVEPNILKSDIKEAEAGKTVELPVSVEPFAKINENISDSKLDVDEKRIIIFETIVHDETIVDFKGIADDLVLLSSQQKHSSEKETISDSQSNEQFECGVLKSEIISEEVFDKKERFSSDTVPDEVTVNFKGIIDDIELLSNQQLYNLEKETVLVSQSVDESNICESKFKETENLESLETFEHTDKNNYIVKSRDAEQGECTVDFKGIATDLKLSSNEQKIISEDKSFSVSPGTSDILKQETEVSSFETNIPKASEKESDKKVVENTGAVSNLIAAEDNLVVDFKGIVLHPELVTDQQDSGIEVANFKSSISVGLIESNILKSETKEIEVPHSEVSVLDASSNAFSNTENENQIQLIEENNAATLENTESEKYIVDFKTIISDSDLLTDIGSTEQHNSSQSKEVSSTAMGSLVSTVESSSQEQIKEVAVSESDEKTTCFVDFKGIVSNSEVYSEKLIFSDHAKQDERNIGPILDKDKIAFSDVRTCLPSAENEKYYEEKLPKEIEQETYSIDFSGITVDTDALSNKQNTGKELGKPDISESAVLLDQIITPGEKDAEKLNYQKEINKLDTSMDIDSALLNTLEDVDNASVFTSDEDFTDVHSHITLTEDSDRWSDVETDTSFAFEDFNQDSFDMREKTPTRDDFECSFGLPMVNATPKPEIQEVLCNVDIPSKKLDSTEEENSSPIAKTENQNVQHSNELEHTTVLDSQITTLSSSSYDEEYQETTSEKSVPLNISPKSVELNVVESEEPRKSELMPPMFEDEGISGTLTGTSNDTTKISTTELVTDSSTTSVAMPPICQPDAFLSDDNTDVMSFNSVTDECETWSDNEMTASLTDNLKPSEKEEKLKNNVEFIIDELKSDAVIEPELSPNVSQNNVSSELLNDKEIVNQISKIPSEAVPVETIPEASLETSTSIILSSEESVIEESKGPVSFSEDKKLSSQSLSKETNLPPDVKQPDSSRENSEIISMSGQNNLSSSFISKEEDSEKFIELDTEISETSSPFFEAVSKDDDSEKICDFAIKNYGESESTAKFSGKLDESIALLSDTSKKDSQLFTSTEAEMESLEEAAFDILPEPVPLVVDKKALSLSIADIVEASELNIACDQTTEPLILEQFADVKSLSHQVAMIEDFNAFESDIAVPKIHKETADVSLGVEKTEESDYWLEVEAETEYSISEFEDEAVSLSDNAKLEQQPSETVDGSGISEDKVHAFETATQVSTEDMTGISASFYTESEYSDQVSDTFADISLQGGTTENSDRWSDIEAEDAINEALAENISIIDAKELIVGVDLDLKEKQESILQSEDIDNVEKESSLAAENLDIKSDTSKELESTSELVEGKQELVDSSLMKVETKDDSKIYKQLSSSSEKLMDMVSGVSDDDFTSVTPIDPTVGESDKWSDIFDDTSVEEMLDSSKSLSLQKDIASQPNSKPETAATVDSVKNINVDHSEITADSLSKNQQLEKPDSHLDLPVETEVLEDSHMETNDGVKDSDFRDDQALLDDICDNHTLQQEKEIGSTIPSDTEDTNRNQSENIIDTKIQDDEYNSRNFPSPIYEDEEPLEGEEYFDEYDPNFDENEMEHAEENYHSGSLPYILNDDELVYPLQYGDDWIEESFDLKEYGIETVFSGSEADVHGLNINEEFDEDIQRAIDFNINNFEEAVESFMDDQNLTTESFKTLSDHTPTQSKLTDKEHDSWSTADADSIVDDLSDHDDVLAKIDEILAEDFGYGKIDYFDDKKGNDDVEEIIEEVEGDIYGQNSPEDSSHKEETDNLLVDDFVYQETITTETQGIPEVLHKHLSDVSVTNENSKLTEKCGEDSSSLLKKVVSSSNEITQSGTDEIKEISKIQQPTEETFETEEDILKRKLSLTASKKTEKLEHSEEINLSINETAELKLAPEEFKTSSSEIKPESLLEKTPVLLKEPLKSPEKTDASVDEAVKMKLSSGETSSSSSEVMKPKSSSEETVLLKATSDKIDTSSEGIILQSPTEKAVLSFEDTVKSQSLDKTELLTKETIKRKQSSEEIDVLTEKGAKKSLEKMSGSQEKVTEKSLEEKSISSEKVMNELSEKKAASKEKLLDKSLEKTTLSPEKTEKKSSEKKSSSPEKVVEKSSEKKPLSPEKVMEESFGKKSTPQEKIVEKSSEKVIETFSKKSSVLPEKIIKESSEKKSTLPEKEEEKSLKKSLPPDELEKSKISFVSAPSEEKVKTKSSSEKFAVSTKSTDNAVSSEKSSVSSKEKQAIEKTDGQFEEAVKLKASSKGTSISEEEKIKLKKTDVSSEKIMKLETSSETIAESLEGETPILPKKTSLLSEETVKSKSSVGGDDLRTEKSIKLKESSKDVDASSELTVKKSMKKKSVSSSETVELKSLEKISTSLEEAKKIDIQPGVIPSSPDEAKELKALSETIDTSLGKGEKSNSSLQKTVVSSDEIEKSKVSLEKTDVSSKGTATQKSSTEAASLSSDKIVKLKASLSSSEKSFASVSEEMMVKLPAEQSVVPSKEIENSASDKAVKLKTPLEKTVSVEETVESKASFKRNIIPETDVKPISSFKETYVVPTEVKPDIPLKKKHASDMRRQSGESDKSPMLVSEGDSDTSLSISDIPSESDSKPNIPDKTRRRSRPKTDTVSEDEGARRRRRPKLEAASEDEVPRRRRPKPEIVPEDEGSRRCRPKSEDEGSHPKAPPLPRKRPKRDSSTESLSSSVFLSSSSESLSSFETASLKESSKSDSLPSKTSSSVSEEAPEIPARKAKVKSSAIRQRKGENSEDSSSASVISKSSVKSCDLPPKEAMDLCRKRTSIDERMIKLQNEGKCSTKEKAFIAAKLIEMQFEEEDALLASRQCSSVYHAVKFLTQLCELCNCRFPINLMASMVYCTHRACKECFKAHFTSLIYDRSVFTLLCPICNKPDITDQNIQEYFNHLDMLFRNILDSHVYDLFQRKLRDEVLTKDPNFHWCSQCSSGFIASPRLRKLYCPDCSAITCASCHQTWELEHEGVHCERFQQWKDMHTPEPPPAGLVKYLADRGVTCPSCELVYPQACGGCLMYKCSHCSFEFCGFCSRPYKRGKDCGNKKCESRGMHSHHPYSCLFFLRDIEMSDLQMLLEEESVTYLTIPPKDQIVKSRCQVREQKHIHGSLSEDRCGRDIVPYCAGLCRTHYYEYLAELFRENKTNPLPIMTTRDLQFILRKSRVLVPDRVKGETNDDYYKRLTEAVSSTLT